MTLFLPSKYDRPHFSAEGLPTFPPLTPLSSPWFPAPERRLPQERNSSTHPVGDPKTYHL